MPKSIIFLFIFCLTASVKGQSIRKYITECNAAILNSPFNTKSPSLPPEEDGYNYQKTFLFTCNKIKTLYSVPILKSLIEVSDGDTVKGIKIFFPFDTTLLHGLASDLGRSETVWMAFYPGQDTNNIIWDKKWFVDNYTVFF